MSRANPPPQIGWIVLYQMGAKAVRPALITAVRGADSVDLISFGIHATSIGNHATLIAVEAASYSALDKVGSWRYPPKFEEAGACPEESES